MTNQYIPHDFFEKCNENGSLLECENLVLIRSNNNFDSIFEKYYNPTLEEYMIPCFSMIP